MRGRKLPGGTDCIRVIVARDCELMRVQGTLDTLTLRPEMRVPDGRGGRTVVVEQRLNRRDVARMLTAFDTLW